jgi:tripartite-type tricarboxylate transporter receptor subunit TctC
MGKEADPMKQAITLLGAVILLAVATPGLAQTDYPAKPITLIVPFPAGGRTDVIARTVAQQLQVTLKQPIAVINKPGASSVLGSNEVAEAKPDGYTLGFFSTSVITAQYTVPTPLSLKSFDLVAIVNADPAAVAVADSAPWQSLRDLVIAAKEKPNALRIGMIPGASAQIFAAGLERSAGVSMIEVPFKGDTDGAIALAGGHIEVHVAVPVSYKALVESKKVRILAVAADARSPVYANAPTFRENDVDLTIGAFHGVFVPKGTSPAVSERIADAIEAALASPESIEHFKDVGAAILFLRGENARIYLAKQDETYRTIIDALGLNANSR